MSFTARLSSAGLPAERAVVSAAHLQSFAFPVEQFGDVSCHLLHQVLGRISLHTKMISLVSINLWEGKGKGQACGDFLSDQTSKMIEV